MTAIRTFLAIPLTKPLIKALADKMTLLQQQFSHENIKWSKIENWHLTLCFIGELSPEQMLAVQQQVALAVRNQKKFKIRLTQIELFPPQQKRPHAIVLGIKPSKSLSRLATTIAMAVQQCGLSTEDRPYLPHITLGRIRSKNLEDLDFSGELPQQMSVSGFNYYRSDPTEAGSQYTILYQYRLKT